MCEIGPKGVLYFSDSHFREQARNGLGLTHSRFSFLSNLFQSVFGLFHPPLVSLTKSITREPSFGCPVGFVGLPKVIGRIVLGLQVNGVHNLVVLTSLIISKFRSASHQQNHENSQNVASRDDLVSTSKIGGTSNNHLPNVGGFGQYNLPSWWRHARTPGWVSLPILILSAVHDWIFYFREKFEAEKKSWKGMLQYKSILVVSVGIQ
mmetsp:Transcript_17008/g.31474  ORF Transcript_17008/g.31474 Transcript_17008/m.31474 type:complete len:207 (-) Transcript_17008:384-1004(-)